MSDSLRPHELQHTRLPCPSLSPEFAQTHVHWVGDSIQPSHPLLPPSPPVLNLSQHQGLFQWVGFSHQMAKVLELQLQYQPFQWIFSVDFLEDWVFWSPFYPRDSQESSPAPQFKSINSSALAFFMVQLSQGCTTTRKTIGLSIQTFVDKVVSLIFNMLSRFVIAFLPRSKHLLIHGVHCGSTIMKSWRIKNLMEDAGLKIQ